MSNPDREKLASLIMDDRVEISQVVFRDPDTRVGRGFNFGARGYAPDVATPRGYRRPVKDGVSTIMNDGDTIDDDVFERGLGNVRRIVEDNGFTMSTDVEKDDTSVSEDSAEKGTV